jgi:hypothetical protein
MIVSWEVDAGGTVTTIHGFYATDEEFKKAMVELMASGKDIHAGDISEFNVDFIPASVKVNRTP